MMMNGSLFPPHKKVSFNGIEESGINGFSLEGLEKEMSWKNHYGISRNGFAEQSRTAANHTELITTEKFTHLTPVINKEPSNQRGAGLNSDILQLHAMRRSPSHSNSRRGSKNGRNLSNSQNRRQE